MWTHQFVFCRETRAVIWERTMRRTILAAVAVLAIGGAATGIMIANAQPAPPPAGMEGRPHVDGLDAPRS